MKSKTSHKIKRRTQANDKFMTPPLLAKTAIGMIKFTSSDKWLEPFKGTGNYFNQFPTQNKDWCEIDEGKDFFKYNYPVDIICTNPPYSILDDVFKHSIALRPRVIQYLLGIGNLTARRIEMFENAGYGLTKLHLCKVFKWYGMSLIVVFEKDVEDNILSYDRIVWR